MLFHVVIAGQFMGLVYGQDATATQAPTDCHEVIPDGGDCVDGDYKCSGLGFVQCVHGKWLNKDCSAGTQCRPDAAFKIACDWPSNIKSCGVTSASVGECHPTVDDGGDCVDGDYECSGDGFVQCVHGKWLNRDCAVGTLCRKDDLFKIACDWPHNVACSASSTQVESDNSSNGDATDADATEGLDVASVETECATVTVTTTIYHTVTIDGSVDVSNIDSTTAIVEETEYSEVSNEDVDAQSVETEAVESEETGAVEVESIEAESTETYGTQVEEECDTCHPELKKGDDCNPLKIPEVCSANSKYMQCLYNTPQNSLIKRQEEEYTDGSWHEMKCPVGTVCIMNKGKVECQDERFTTADCAGYSKN